METAPNKNLRFHQKVLLLTGKRSFAQAKRRKSLLSKWKEHPFFPGSRERNYAELLQGSGIPFEVRDASTLKPADIVNDTEVRYSAIIFTLPFAEINPEFLFWIGKASSQHGVSLIADTFLFRENYFLLPFGLLSVGTERFAPRLMRNGVGKPLYLRKHLPYCGNGFAIGIRPFLRLFLQNWRCRDVRFSDQAVVEASYGKNLPAVTSLEFGDARNWVLNFCPSRILREGNGLHNLLRNAVLSNRKAPFVALDFGGTLCLRMDDPGSSERVHLEGFNPGVIRKEDWEILLRLLDERKAVLNVAYVPGWIDDGDWNRGTLEYQGEEVKERPAGKLYRSWEVAYEKKGTANSHDYAAEYQEIRKGVETGTVSILSHGLTHLTTQIGEWVKAKDRYTKKEWFREFREMAARNRLGRNGMVSRMKQGREMIQEAFGVLPSILVPSAHEQTEETTSMAKEAGFPVFSSKATVFLSGAEPFTNRKLMAFYPEDKEEGLALCDAGYPVCYVFHDYDVYRNGTVWLGNTLAEFAGRGISSFPSMELVVSLLSARIESVSERGTVRVCMEFPFIPVSCEQGKMTVPFTTTGKVRAITVFGEPINCEIRSDGVTSRFSLPLSLVRDGKLEFCVESEASRK